MYYRNNAQIPQEFNKIADISDNYIVWVEQSKLYSDRTYEAYIQYMKPNFYILHIENYTINKGSNYKIIPNYTNNGMYSYIEDYNLTYELETSLQTSGEDYTSKIDYLPDYNEINISIFCLMVAIVWVFNNISKLWSKGGCFKWRKKKLLVHVYY